MTPFWTFLTFSLLSYIEIYIEYREKASGVMWEPLGGSKNVKKLFVLFGPYISQNRSMLVDFQKRCFWDTLPLSVGPARCQTLTISGGSKTFFYFSSKKIFKGKKNIWGGILFIFLEILKMHDFNKNVHASYM